MIVQKTDILNNCPDVVNVHTLRKILGIGKNKTYELLQSRKIQSIRVGTNYKIPKHNIVEFLLTND